MPPGVDTVGAAEGVGDQSSTRFLKILFLKLTLPEINLEQVAKPQIGDLYLDWS